MRNIVSFGGILAHGIPKFRLDKEILDKTIKSILDLGVEVNNNKELGKDFTLEELKKNYDAVFIGIGANLTTKMNIEGEDLEGVYGANILLETGIHPNYKGKTVAVIGGGNVAMDCSRTINKLGAKKVYVIYRRSEEQMPAERKEIEDAKKEKVEFLFQNNVIKILGTNRVEKLECIKTELVKKGEENRLSPIDIQGTNYLIDVDFVIMAVGSKAEENITKRLGLELTDKGYIKVDKNYQTSDKKVFAGGDIIGSPKTIAWAAKDGREAVNSIRKMLNN